MTNAQNSHVTIPREPAAADALIEQFERAWRSGTPPALEDFLASLKTQNEEPTTYRQTLIELVKIDLEYRWRAARSETTFQGQQTGDGIVGSKLPRVEDYVARFPELSPVPLDLIAEEYRVRHQWGDRPGQQEYFERFGELSAALAETLAQIDRELAVERSRAVEDSRTQEEQAQLPTIPGYEILEVLGRGGMGVVYRARQEQPRRLVALKMILGGAWANPDQRSRFKREIQAVGSLEHPNIVRLYEAREEGDCFFFTQEFVAGGTLAEKLAGNPQPAQQAAALIEPLARAIHYAHQHGVIHRDLKPSNILLASGGREPPDRSAESGGSRPPLAELVPKISDFGLAKQVETDSAQTKSGAIMGTPSYMAPEQAEGKAHQAGPPADVYALGAILYEMLTGRPPFRGETPLDTVLQVVSEEPIPPSRLNSKVPRDLETVCLKCLQKQPRKRYADAADLAEDLRRFQVGEPILARPAGRAERTWKWMKRRPAAAALIGVLVLSGLMALSLAAWALGERDHAITARNETQKKHQEVEQERAIAQAVSDFLQNDLLRLASSWHQATDQLEPEPDLKVRELLDRAAAKIEEKFQKQPLIQAAIRLAIGDAYRDVGEYSKAQEHLGQSTALRKLHLGPNHPDTLRSMHTLVDAYLRGGKLDLGLPLAEEALKLRKAKLGPSHPDTLDSMNLLGTGYTNAGKQDLAVSLYEQTLELAKAKLGAEDHRTLRGMNNLAYAYQTGGKRELALPLLEESLKLHKAKLGPNHPDTFMSMNNLAGYYLEGSKPNLALPLFEETLRLRKAKLGRDHPDTLQTMNNLGWVYQMLGKHALAIQLHEETLELAKAKLGPDHPRTLNSMAFLASTYRAAGKLDMALPLYEETLKLHKAKLGSDHPATLRIMGNLAWCYRAAGKLNMAVPLFEQSVQLTKAKLGLEHPDTLGSMESLALAYEDKKEFHNAELLRVELVAIRRKKHGREHLITVQTLVGLADNLLQQQKWSEAESHLRECLQIREQQQPDDWTTFNTRSVLGAALFGQKKYYDAEPLLQEGYDGMKQRAKKIPPKVAKLRLPEAEGRLAELFEATRQKEESKLRGKLTNEATESVHEIKVTAGRPAVIEMHSGQFDTLLRLTDAKGKLLVENDDIDVAAKKTNSRIWFMPPADGTYRIVATSYQNTGRGDYEITIRQYGQRKPAD